MAGQEHQVTLTRGKRHELPADAIAPILVFAHARGARIRFRGEVRRLQGDKCATYAKQNKAPEVMEVLDGTVELQYSTSGNAERKVAV